MYRLKYIQRLDNRAGREHLQADPTSGNFSDFFSKIECELVKQIFRRPGTLKTQINGFLSPYHGWKSQGASRTTR
jgi:hypothetical protein